MIKFYTDYHKRLIICALVVLFNLKSTLASNYENNRNNGQSTGRFSTRNGLANGLRSSGMILIGFSIVGLLAMFIRHRMYSKNIIIQQHESIV